MLPLNFISLKLEISSLPDNIYKMECTRFPKVKVSFLKNLLKTCHFSKTISSTKIDEEEFNANFDKISSTNFL